MYLEELSGKIDFDDNIYFKGLGCWRGYLTLLSRIKKLKSIRRRKSKILVIRLSSIGDIIDYTCVESI